MLIQSNEPTRLDIIHRQKSKQVFTLQIVDTAGAVVDISGRRYVLVVAKTRVANKSDRLLVLDTLSSGLRVVDGPGGVLEVTIDDFVEAEKLPPGEWAFTLDYVPSPTNLEPAFGGAFTVTGRP